MKKRVFEPVQGLTCTIEKVVGNLMDSESGKTDEGRRYVNLIYSMSDSRKQPKRTIFSDSAIFKAAQFATNLDRVIARELKDGASEEDVKPLEDLRPVVETLKTCPIYRINFGLGEIAGHKWEFVPTDEDGKTRTHKTGTINWNAALGENAASIVEEEIKTSVIETHTFDCSIPEELFEREDNTLDERAAAYNDVLMTEFSDLVARLGVLRRID